MRYLPRPTIQSNQRFCLVLPDALMTKESEVKKCPKCPYDMIYTFDRGPHPDDVAAGKANPATAILRRYWKCESCGHEDNSSAPAAE